MIETIPNPDPLGLPIPALFLFGLRTFGFLLHLIFMNLWLAGLPTALLLPKSRGRLASRLFQAMPFFMAFGINAGIVPLLFLQTLYPQFFYPAVILQAWFWFLVIPLLIIAYTAVYRAAFGRGQRVAAVAASLLLAWIGLTFSSAMSLTTSVEKWPAIFLSTAQAGSVNGLFIYLDPETFLRFFLILGMAFGTVAVYLALDAQWLSHDSTDRGQVSQLVFLLYGVGLVLYGMAGGLYAPTVMDKLPRLLWLLAGLSMPAGALLSLAYWKRPGKRSAVSLAACHLIVLISNAVAREMVQFQELRRWVDFNAMPVRGDWAGFFLFVIVLIIVAGVLAWMARITLRATRAKI